MDSSYVSVEVEPGAESGSEYFPTPKRPKKERKIVRKKDQRNLTLMNLKHQVIKSEYIKNQH